MVDVDENGHVRGIIIKPRDTHLAYTWMIAVWKPAFTNFMHEYLNPLKQASTRQTELFVSEVIQAAIQDGLRIDSILVSEQPSLDIGTPEDLVRAVKRFTFQATNPSA